MDSRLKKLANYQAKNNSDKTEMTLSAIAAVEKYGELISLLDISPNSVRGLANLNQKVDAFVKEGGVLETLTKKIQAMLPSEAGDKIKTLLTREVTTTSSMHSDLDEISKIIGSTQEDEAKESLKYTVKSISSSDLRKLAEQTIKKAVTAYKLLAKNTPSENENVGNFLELAKMYSTPALVEMDGVIQKRFGEFVKAEANTAMNTHLSSLGTLKINQFTASFNLFAEDGEEAIDQEPDEESNGSGEEEAEASFERISPKVARNWEYRVDISAPWHLIETAEGVMQFSDDEILGAVKDIRNAFNILPPEILVEIQLELDEFDEIAESFLNQDGFEYEDLAAEINDVMDRLYDVADSMGIWIET